jgi:hypothetical protein
VVVVCDNTEVAIAVKAKVTSILFMSLPPISRQNGNTVFKSFFGAVKWY